MSAAAMVKAKHPPPFMKIIQLTKKESAVQREAVVRVVCCEGQLGVYSVEKLPRFLMLQCVK